MEELEEFIRYNEKMNSSLLTDWSREMILQAMQIWAEKQCAINGVVSSALKAGDIIEISGYYFDWEVKEGYSPVLKQTGTYAIAQGGLMHSDLKDSRILRVNGKKPV